MARDWTGSESAAFKIIGASNHSSNEREENDFYATDPRAMDELLLRERFQKRVWEPAVGQGHLARRLEQFGHEVRCSDVIDRGYPNTEIVDFLNFYGKWDGDIVTNPPYKFANAFIENALRAVSDGAKVAMFLKLTALEGEERYRKIYSVTPPLHIYVFVKRVQCARNGDFEGYGNGSAVCYAWFVWQKGYAGDPVVRWIHDAVPVQGTLF